jgi:TRAP-type mannitol/chloroaromatic compound transport system permease small subunit
MAAFFTSHIFAPRVALRRASAFTTPRVSRRRSIHLGEAAARVAAAAGEILFFLWTLLTLAFSFLIMAGFLE